ncbi:MAG: hypothetical protein MZV64_02205 [Ignavibacteriales bacterium]|nr:hypothetical protein [Ignavibacteriales bacterium]
MFDCVTCAPPAKGRRPAQRNPDTRRRSCACTSHAVRSTPPPKSGHRVRF